VNELSEVEERLLKAAEEKTQTVVWNGPEEGGAELLAAVSGLRGASAGADWLDALPKELIQIWASLSLESQLAAFIVAAERSYSFDMGGESS